MVQDYICLVLQHVYSMFSRDIISSDSFNCKLLCAYSIVDNLISVLKEAFHISPSVPMLVVGISVKVCCLVDCDQPVCLLQLLNAK